MLRSAEPDEIWISTVARLSGMDARQSQESQPSEILHLHLYFATCGLRRLKHYGSYRRTHGAGTAEASANFLLKMLGC